MLGLILDIFFLSLAEKCWPPVSSETMRAFEEQKKYKKMNKGYKCPNCGKKAGHEMSTISKSVSVKRMRLASNKIGKTYTCANCKYMW